MVPMHAKKPKEAFHEPDRHLLSPSLSSARSGGEGARRVGEEALRFKVPMHSKNEKGLSMNQWVYGLVTLTRMNFCGAAVRG